MEKHLQVEVPNYCIPGVDPSPIAEDDSDDPLHSVFTDIEVAVTEASDLMQSGAVELGAVMVETDV